MSVADLKAVLNRWLARAIEIGRRAAAACWQILRRAASGVSSFGAAVKELMAQVWEKVYARPHAGGGGGWRLARQSAPRLGRGELGAMPGPVPLADGPVPAAMLPVHSNFSRHVLDRPLALAFLLSLIIHASLYSGWRWGKQMGLWEHQATWLLDLTKKAHKRVSQLQANSPVPPKEIPLTFVDVDPALASEPPKEAKFYGAHNSIAANPVPDVAKQPKIEGNQTKIVRVEDNPPMNPQPLQPSVPEPPAVPAPKPEPVTAGETTLAKPDPASVQVNTNPARPDRPRTIREARLRKGMIAGQKMRQPGGVARRGRISLDVKATPFGAYDAAFIAAVQQRWYQLIDTSRVRTRSGKVVLVFRLGYDGRITNLSVREEAVGEMLSLLCQRAILDPAPYPPWPSDMRRLIGKNYRDVVFTFYYY